MGSIIGSIIGNEASGDDRRAARDSGSEATGAFRDIKVPTIEEQKIQLKLLQQMGVLSPELEQALELAPSKMEDISTDPKIRDAQLQALETLRQQGNTGLTSQDTANLNQIRNQEAQQLHGQEQAILQNAAQRGVGGAGQELAAQLQASQAGANRASAQGDDLAAQSQQRALQAIAQAGGLAGQMNSQDFSQNSAKAQAADAISKFNTANSQDVQGRNVGRNNQAEQYNLSEKQHIADSNIGLQNQQEMYNKALYQQQFQNNMNKAQGLSGQLRQNQAQQNAEGQRKSAMWSGIGAGVDNGAAAIASGGASSAASMSPSQLNSNSNSAMIDNGYYGFGSTMGGGYADGGMIGDPVVQNFANGGMLEQAMKLAPMLAMLASEGGTVPGQANVQGDSVKNDTIPAMLSPGEVVLPRTVVQHGNAHEIAAFVEHAKHEKKHEVAMQSLTAINKILKNMSERK